MLINKGKLFLHPKNPFSPLSTDHIKNGLCEIRDKINELVVLQERQCLPSFVSRKTRMEEISNRKNEINNTIETLDKDINRVENFKLPTIMRKTIRNYFSKELQQIVHKYRSIQQDFLKKVSCMEIFDKLEENEEVAVLLDNKKQINDIRQSIFSLTTTLMELKMLVVDQNWKMDRIEFYMIDTNENIKKTNMELMEMPNSRIFFKNRIIYCLLLFVCILMVLTLVKVYRHKKQMK